MLAFASCPDTPSFKDVAAMYGADVEAKSVIPTVEAITLLPVPEVERKMATTVAAADPEGCRTSLESFRDGKKIKGTLLGRSA